MSLWFSFRNDKWDIPFGVPFDIPYRENWDIPLKMITYNFEMIKNDCLFEMKSHRLIIERRFFASGVPAVLCVIRTSGKDTSRITHKTVGWKKSPIKIESKQSLWNDEWVTYWYDCATFPFEMIEGNPFEITNDCLFEMSKSPYLVLKWYMTVILKWGVSVLCSFRDDIWLSFRNDGAKFWSRELFWSTNELSYEHKRAMVKRSQMEECSPIRAVFFCFFVTKIWNLSQQDIQCRTLIFVSKCTK